jgi:hypothetical protein
VSAEKVVGFLLGVNGSEITENAQTPCKHWWFAGLAQRQSNGFVTCYTTENIP